jgi:hypothetical protein
MPVSADGDGVRLRVRVTPRARKTVLAGVVDADGGPALAIRLAAPPVDGAANRALLAFLSDELQVPRSKIRIVTGETGRLKLVAVAGLSLESAEAWIKRSA